MKVESAQFLEGVENPVRGNGQVSQLERFKSKAEGPLRCRVMGPGLILEGDNQSRATLVPWANVKFAVVDIEEGDAAPGKAKK